MRPKSGSSWTDLSSHAARQKVKVKGASSQYLASADITPSLGSNLPITVQRTWTQDKDSLILSFNITNVGMQALEFGGVGMPIPINDDWVGKNQDDTWQQSVVSDFAMSLDAGYVLTNRLTGEAPTLLTTPMSKSEFKRISNGVDSNNAY